MLTTRVRGLCALTLPVVALAFPDLAEAAGAVGLENVVYVADSRGQTGIHAWFSNLYNESSAWFTAVTVVTIPVTGVVLGLLADFGMSQIGIDLKSRQTGEH